MGIPSISQRTGLCPVRGSSQKLPLNGFTEWNFLRNKEKHIRIGNNFDCVEGVRLGLRNPRKKERKKELHKQTNKQTLIETNPLSLAGDSKGRH